jgi:PPOX class probable F420-dependent enzyme
MTFDELARAPYVSLATYRRTGAAVPTPVWVASDGERLYVWTRTDSGKVKRLRNSDRVTMTPCDARGRILGGAATREGRAELLDRPGTDRVRALLRDKYRWRFLAVDLSGAMLRLGRRPHVGIAITL